MKKFFALLVVGLAFAAQAQDAYPSRAVNAIVGFPPGGISDLILRQLAEGMRSKFPAGLVVLNKPGGGGTTALSVLSADKPDGYNFAIAPNANLSIGPQISSLHFKNPDDYTVVMNTVSSAPVLVVKADSPVKNAKEFVAAAKAQPGVLSVGYPGEASVSQLSLAQISRATGIKVINVPFAGWAQGSPALLGGHVFAMIAQPGEVMPYLQAGTLRAIGTVSPTRLESAPQIPTWKEQGFDVALGTKYYLVVPKATPANVVKYIHDAAKATMDEPSFKEFAKQRGVEIEYADGKKSKEWLWEDYKSSTVLLQQVGLLK